MKPDRDHRGGRYFVSITFDMPTYEPMKAELRQFIKDALETWGGQGHPDDPLFSSLGQVSVHRIVKVKTPKPRKQRLCY